ncbi:S-layer domain-containing protein [Pseudobacteroides cellulosolvens ATCC 35603 = DSM 2933]|uniref:S-layer domain-containing protein n=2 Tax=Pseudobacteroides cellulosolvens TaxID=35825 RepID=A0A0L6JU19_9FIRM|nr:S-layer domain-containing protein [Pseudobacteroides cellulosolvens ATCC 35603 = DSM 2933]
MATPFVTATAALLWSINPSYSFSKVKEVIKVSAKEIDSLKEKVETSGMVNAFKASLPGLLPYDNGVLTRTTDNIIVNNFTSGSLSGYSFNDMVPLVDGWVIIADIVKNKVSILNVFSGEVAEEYHLNSSPDRIDFNPETGKIIATQRSSNYIALIDAYTNEIKYIPLTGSCPDVVFAKNNYAAAIIETGTAWWDKKISILDLESSIEITSVPGQSEDFGYLAYDRSTNNILAGESGSSSCSLHQFAFDENTKTIEKKNTIRDMAVFANDLAMSPDGHHAVFLGGGGYTTADIDATNINNKLGTWNLSSCSSAAFTKDSKYVLLSSNYIHIFDVQTHTLVEKLSNKPGLSKVSISNGSKIAFGKDGDGNLFYYIVNLPSPTTETPSVSPLATPTPTLSQTSTPIAASTATPTPTIVLNTSIPELTRMTDNIDVNNLSSGSISGYNISDMIPVADGWAILSDISQNKVLIINALTGDTKKSFQLNESPGKIDFNPENGKIIAAQYSSNSVALIDPYTENIKYIPVSGSPLDVVFAKNNYAVVLLSTGEAWYDKKISVFDWNSGVEAASFSAQSEAYNFLACDRATNNILAGESGTSPSSLTQLVFNENTNKLEKKNDVWNMGSNGQDLAISPDGLHAAFACGGGNGSGYTIFDIDATNINNKFGEWYTDAYPRSASFSKDNKYIITTNGYSIKIFNVKTHILVKTIADSGYTSSFRKVGISNGGKIAYAISEGGKLYYYPINESSIAIPTPIVLNNSIKGKVHLPNNMTADEDIQVEVYLQNAKEKVYSTSVVIKKGTNSQDYTLLSPNASVSDKFRIGYLTLEGGQSFAQAGLYSSSGIVFDEEYAEDLTIGSNLGNINMELLAKRKISGKVSLPDGKAAPSGGVEVKITAGYKEKQYYTGYVTIAEGQKSSDFELTAYLNDSDNKYILQYTLLKDMDGYFSDGFYNGKGTTVNIADATPVDIRHNDASNIQIQILKGRTISGTIKLPDYQTAPEGGIQVEIMASDSDQDAYYSSMVKIDQGKNSVQYSISVPDENISYYVNYFTIVSGYVRSGYYLSGNTVVNPDDAGVVGVYGQHVYGINLTLMKAQTLTGTISLPYGIVAPKEGIRVAVTAKYSSEDLSMYTFTTIKEGENSAQYALQVPLNHGKYTIILNTLEKGYMKEVYSINFSSTSSYYSNATEYDSNTSSENISLQLISGTDITGEIRLYSGIAPSGGISVIVFLYDYSSIAVAETILIPAGSTKTNFTITAPKYTSFYLGYMLPSVESFAFYSNGQMVQDIDSASPIYVANETITGKNMVIKSSFSVINDGNSQNQDNAGNVIAPPVLRPPVATATATSKTPTVTPTPTATYTAQPKPTNIVENPVKKPALGTYKDISGHWAKEYANKLLELGIISGYEDNTIRPNREISRAEAVVIICKSVGLKPAENVKLKFTDNKSIPKWASGYVQVIVDNGILKGYPDNTFKPNAKITRAEVISLVINAFKLGDRANSNHIFNVSSII